MGQMIKPTRKALIVEDDTEVRALAAALLEERAGSGNLDSGISGVSA
jgi:hypothetical protein